MGRSERSLEEKRGTDIEKDLEGSTSKRVRKRAKGAGRRKGEDARHYNMQRIKSKDTSIELKLRKALWAKGYRYRKNVRELPGVPDIVLTKYKIAIFCDSEFFHGKDWEVLKPQLERGNNAQFWIDKITRTKERDDAANKQLLYLGWTVIRFWGKDILKDVETCVKVVEETIFDNDMAREPELDDEILEEDGID